jgi:hypothetical protein
MCLLKVEEAEISRMSFTGHVVDGQVVLDGPMPLPNGTPVRVEPIAHGEPKNGTPSEPPRTLAHRWKRFFSHTVDLPADAAHQHDHYLYGSPKK